MSLAARYPMSLTPDGWYQVGYSDEIAAGQVRPVTALGRELVLYRTADGVARSALAHCPHQGAHLGYGGVVEGDTIRCPFHHWRFGADGGCLEIPNAVKVPPGARLELETLHESDGVLYLRQGATPAPPPPDLALDPEKWVTVRHIRSIRTHAQDIGENIVDAAHFRHVHGLPHTPQTRVEIEGGVLRSFSTLRQVTPRGTVDTTIDGVAYGLGIWHLAFRGICDTLVLACPTPVDGERLDFRLTFHVPRGTERGVGGAMIDEIMFQADQDIPIWEHKIYRERPVLSAADAPIAAMRKWSRQFYAERA